MGTITRVQALACALHWRDDANPMYIDTAESVVAELMALAPSGSGFDSGTHLQEWRAKPERIILRTEFHHMDDHGCYSQWSNHTAIITPSFDGFEMRITGRDYRDIKDYIAEVFDGWLNEPVDWHETVDKARQ